LLALHWLGGGQPALAGALQLTFARKDARTLLVADFHPQQPNLFLLDEHGQIAGAMDERPMLRHVASIAYTGLLRGLLGFRGTDTHGLKAFRRSAILPLVDACVADKDVFSSELVIRAYRTEQRIVEIPIRVLEKRPPSINLFKRVPNVLKNLAKLTYAIRVRG